MARVRVGAWAAVSPLSSAAAGAAGRARQEVGVVGLLHETKADRLQQLARHRLFGVFGIGWYVQGAGHLDDGVGQLLVAGAAGDALDERSADLQVRQRQLVQALQRRELFGQPAYADPHAGARGDLAQRLYVVEVVDQAVCVDFYDQVPGLFRTIAQHVLQPLEEMRLLERRQRHPHDHVAVARDQLVHAHADRLDVAIGR
ncbi:Uncharacterised protein [Bordetella pertussis]|nr:Uncharacterised protein [Bordetella pertussis]